MKEPLIKSRKFKITILGLVLNTLSFALILYLMDSNNERYNEQIISLFGSYVIANGGILVAFIGAKLFQERNYKTDEH